MRTPRFEGKIATTHMCRTFRMTARNSRTVFERRNREFHRITDDMETREDGAAKCIKKWNDKLVSASYSFIAHSMSELQEQTTR